ncbi:MAG TPA: aminotransferase class I/II-fold pyridoxal phosphate-dependent enzyme [Terriglobales bacterium]|jgi:cystathionine beta-lyase|nr:aminotransferase class I/II-fold pyridoxal phosphate-dependent enzyme [Terriglobales bacterium]
MKKRHPETVAIHGGSEPEHKSGPLATPIFQTSTFAVEDNDEQSRVTHSDKFYTRYGNPTHTVAEQTIAQLEGAEAALLFASGMAAITTTVLALVRAGDHIVAQADLYGGAMKFFSHWLPKFGVETSFVETTRAGDFERVVRPNTRLMYLESPTNPTLKLVDLGRAVAIAKRHGLTTLIDNTFATPINQRPIEQGVDIVLHSATKYMGGHSDLIAGVAAGSQKLMQQVWETRTTLGGTMDPHASFLLLRGLKTLVVRVERHNQNALRVAQFLEKHARVKRVNYPFLASHPQHALAVQQMSGGGGLLSFEVEGTAEETRRFTESLRVFALAPSLGGVDSLVTLPVVTSHAMVSPEERKQMGITEQLVRLAIGIENAEDLIADLEQALAAIAPAKEHAHAD